MTQPNGKLNGISDIRRFFHRNETPLYFISATNFNLLGADEWVRGFKFINYLDCFDGQHPNVFVPGEMPHEVFQSIEEINNYLLEHKEVADYIKRRGPGGKALFLMFDEQTEAGECVELPCAEVLSRQIPQPWAAEAISLGSRFRNGKASWELRVREWFGCASALAAA
jgi:hypothetical protein